MTRRGGHESAATRAKISAALRGRHHPHRGRRWTPAQRAALSARLRGRRHPHKGWHGHRHYHGRHYHGRRTRVQRRLSLSYHGR